MLGCAELTSPIRGLHSSAVRAGEGAPGLWRQDAPADLIPRQGKCSPDLDGALLFGEGAWCLPRGGYGEHS